MIAASVLVASAAIFHGAPAQNAPWFVSLEQGGAFCGGALIAPDKVLTAAHCVQGSGPKDFKPRVGGRLRDWRGAYFPTKYRIIASPVLPDDYNASATTNDIAIIVLRQPVADVPTLGVAATPPTDGEATITIGRGQTDPDSFGSDAPLQAGQIVRDCSSLYPPSLLHTTVHLCTQDSTATASQACSGDSGSPVLVTRAGQLQVAGVVTWGGETLARKCGEGPADVSERVLAHTSLLTTVPKAFAPYPTRAITRRCRGGGWRPRSARLTVRRVRSGCRVIARTPGGWAVVESTG